MLSVRCSQELHCGMQPLLVQLEKISLGGQQTERQADCPFEKDAVHLLLNPDFIFVLWPAVLTWQHTTLVSD